MAYYLLELKIQWFWLNDFYNDFNNHHICIFSKKYTRYRKSIQKTINQSEKLLRHTCKRQILLTFYCITL